MSQLVLPRGLELAGDAVKPSEEMKAQLKAITAKEKESISVEDIDVVTYESRLDTVAPEMMKPVWTKTTCC